MRGAWYYDTLGVYLILRAQIPVPVTDLGGRVAAIPQANPGLPFEVGRIRPRVLAKEEVVSWIGKGKDWKV